MAHDHKCICCDRLNDNIVITATPMNVSATVTIIICPRCLVDDINAKVVALAIVEKLLGRPS